MANKDEMELEKFFIEHYAATMNSDDDMGEGGAAGVSSDDMKAAGDILSEVADDGESKPENADEDKSIFGEDSDFLKSKEQNQKDSLQDIIPWDANFKILLSQEKMQEQEEAFGGQASLDPGEDGEPDKAAKNKIEAPSWYIWCKPLNKRVEGIWNEHLFKGFGTKEEMGENLALMKTENFSPDGFPKEKISTMLKDIKQPSSITDKVVREVDTAQQQKPQQPQQQQATPAPVSPPAPAAQPAIAKPKIPEPVASFKDIQKRRILRAKLAKSL